MGQFNILMAVVDSVKATALSVYGNPHCRTPNVEWAANRGVTVSHCFGQMPKCVPNRSTMLTGRYPHVDGLRALKGRQHPVGRTDLFVIPRDMPNILPLLKEAGYELCHKGPNHLVTWDAYEEWFEVPMDWEAAERCVRPTRTTEDEELVRAQYYGPIPDDYDIELTHDAESTRQMVEFLRTRDRARPFFAYLDLRTPHPAYRDWPVYAEHYEALEVPTPPKAPLDEAPWAERVYRETYDLEDMAPEKWARIMRAYYSGVSVADLLFGRVLDALEREGLTEDTVVVFTADHGDFAGEHGCVEKHDPLLYDCLTRLPFIVQMPSRLPRGRFADCMMEQIDLAPTILELVGLEVPRWIQGRSILPLLSGECETHKEAVFAQGGVEGINSVQMANAMLLSSWTGDQWVDVPIDDDLYCEKLEEKRAASKPKEVAADADVDDLDSSW